MSVGQRETGAGRLVAVVVTCNRLTQLQVTLPRLLESPPGELHAVVVIDNASTDGTWAWLEAQIDPRLLVRHSPVNRGGAGGFAAGARLAVERFDPDWLLMMDDDARPEPGALRAFHALEHGACEAVAAAVYFPGGQICEMNRPSRNPFWHGREFIETLRRGRSGFHLSPADYAAPTGRRVDVTSFVGFFLSRRGLEMAGFPDPSLFLYADDGLYTLGLSRAGGRIRFEPTVRFEHDCSTFGAAQRGQFRPLWKTYYYHRNLLMLYRLAAGWLFWPALCLILPKWLLKTRAHPGMRGRFIGLMLRAVRDGLVRRTGVPHETVLRWSGEDAGV
ncbi:glycosyltransferase [Pseudoponticoccus marisrubri]|uniref:Glycosyltransferase n=1 Tax=Pseudoponticoccus marisrubri TaxID=1685382 RepID=A0A0W7WEG4_9RHOB|nr:glycosyltransferase [Pseudoponticoccus marisrubri]KUF08953.1 glycosyltransferase [Pseudoponticoccus marisrubri]